MSRNILTVVVAVIGLVAAGGITLVAMDFDNTDDIVELTGESHGTFYINDCGRPKGGFEYAGTYYANLTLDNGTGTLEIVLKVGLGDPLDRHVWNVTLLEYTNESMQLDMDGYNLEMEWVDNDTIWNGQYDGNYTALWGPEMTDYEPVGHIRTDWFPGTVAHYYVELRLPRLA